MATTDTLTSADRAFVRGIDDAVRDAVRRAGRHVQCRRGCTPCCIGVFDITALVHATCSAPGRRVRGERA